MAQMSHTVPESKRALRADKALALAFPGHSRTALQRAFDAGLVTLRGVAIKRDQAVCTGSVLEFSLPDVIPTNLEPADIPLDVIFEDKHMLALNKPAGMVVHPGAATGNDTLVHALLGHCAGTLSGIGGVERPGIVHRLDKDVSGLLVVAKHDRVHQGLAGQFTVHSVERLYEALVYGLPNPTEGTIDQPIARHPNDRKRMAIVGGGKRAVTRYRLIEAAGTRITRLELALETGRTHQIRVHLSSLGHSLLGDRIYKPRKKPPLPAALGEAIETLERVALHARVLGFTHPRTGEKLRFESAPPAIFDRLTDLARVT